VGAGIWVGVCVCVCVCVCVSYLQCSKIPGNLINQKVLYLQLKLKSCFLFVGGMKSQTQN